jgi:hypothetical protein
MPAPSRRPRLSVLPVVLLVAVAFVLGSVGTASAGAALTRSAVKKIATKVVTKQAATLSVRHATTADSALTAANADKVGGATAAQLGVRPIVYTIPKGQTYPATKTWALDSNQLSVGTYLASFHAVLDTTSTFAECQLENGSATDHPLDVYLTAAPGHALALNGTGLVTVGAGDVFQFRCLVGATWTPAYAGHLTLTPVASVTTGSLLTLP